jgi:hypothetical protein
LRDRIKQDEVDGGHKESAEVKYKVWWRNLKDGGHLEDQGVDGRILKQILTGRAMYVGV